jgi:hypothetical protein
MDNWEDEDFDAPVVVAKSGWDDEDVDIAV